MCIWLDCTFVLTCRLNFSRALVKTFIAEIIPKLQKYSQKLDNLTLLTNQHWVVVDEIANSKTVYIFRSNNELLISKNGEVEKANWEYLGNNALLLDLKEKSYLFRHGFFDENVLALKIDGKEEYALMVNESKFEQEFDSHINILEFLQHKYVAPCNEKAIVSETDSIVEVAGKEAITPSTLTHVLEGEEKVKFENAYEFNKRLSQFVLIAFGVSIIVIIILIFAFR